jgi:hypothetical protein
MSDLNKEIEVQTSDVVDRTPAIRLELAALVRSFSRSHAFYEAISNT